MLSSNWWPKSNTMQRRRHSQHSLVLSLAAALCLLAGNVGLATAQQQSTPTVTETFTVAPNNDTATGALVSFKPNAANKTVELATSQSADHLIGVIDNFPLISFSSQQKGVHVVLNGTAQVLVSDINGAIKAGDKITASPIAGIGMRATADTQVVGTALNTPSAKGAKTRALKDNHGTAHTIHISSVPAQIGVAYYQSPGSNILPPFVQRAANAIAGRNVSLTRILASSLLLLISMVGITALIYVATRSAMISLGRNPLAAHDIRKSLYQVIAIAGSAAAVTLLAAYLILAL